jgi:hypothetical protein
MRRDAQEWNGSPAVAVAAWLEPALTEARRLFHLDPIGDHARRPVRVGFDTARHGHLRTGLY